MSHTCRPLTGLVFLLGVGLTVSALPGPVLAQDETENVPMTMEPGEPQSERIPLTLREVLALAMEHSLDIAVQRYEPRVSDNRVLGARGVFDPSIGVLAQHQDNTSLSLDPFSQSNAARADLINVGQVSFNDTYSIGGTLNVAWTSSRFATDDPRFIVNPIYNSDITFTYDQSLLRNFGYDVNTTGIRVAKRNVQVSESQFRQTVIDTIQGVEKAYWDLKFALEDLAVKQHSLKLSEETLSQNKIRVEVGTMAPIDVTTADAEVASRRQDVLLAENALENAQDALLLYINQPRTSPLWVLPINPVDDLPFDENMKVDVDAAIKISYENRPDLEQTRFLIANDEDLVAQAKDQTRWDLALRAQYKRAGIAGDNAALTFGDPNMPFLLAAVDDNQFDALRQIYQENFDSWQLSLNLQIPIGNKVARSNYLEARLRQVQRRQVFESQDLAAVIEVRNRARAVDNAVERVKAARVNVGLQRERLEAENKRYENGMTTTFDLFLFQDDLTRAESQVIAALVDYNKALADLEAAKGTLTSARGVHYTDLMYVGDDEDLDAE
ncbi:MAG: TolC family protein [Acidobacteriota bacterium]